MPDAPTPDPALATLRDRIRAALADRTPLLIRAGGTKDFLGNTTTGAVLDPRAVRGIVDYAPSELVVTVRAGTALAELEATLAEQHQMLAFEPPHRGPGATIGGAVAAGLAGPRRMAAGAPRDFLLGAHLLDGRGELLRFGGTVMKNVAGYDVARALAGSLGTLGVLTQLSIKVLPRPRAEATLRFACDEAEALRQVNAWGGQPLPVSATAWAGGTLLVRLSGALAGVEAACGRLGGMRVEADDAAAAWEGLREQTDGFFAQAEMRRGNARSFAALRTTGGLAAGTTGGGAGHSPGTTGGSAAQSLWRLSVPSTTAPLALGDTLIEWGGAQRWVWSDAPAADIRATAAAAGGHATRWRAPAGVTVHDAFHPLTPALLAIHRRLKAEFDPAAILNRGRLYADL